MNRSITLLVPALAIAIAALRRAATPQPSPAATTAPTATPAPTRRDPKRRPLVSAAMAGDIVQTATEAGSFSTLLTAVEAAGLVETLQGEGPYTVFAPTDEAFAALPAGTLDGLLADTEALKKVLLYHVVSGPVTDDKVVGLTSADVGRGIAHRHRRQGRNRLSERQRQGRDGRRHGVERRHPRHRPGHPSASRLILRTSHPPEAGACRSRPQPHTTKEQP